MGRQAKNIETPMRAFPAVIATQGCFAWRNAAPLALSNREMLGIGNDPAPIRLIVLQMLYLLNRRLHATADGYGMKPNLNAYLSQFNPPKFEIGVGDVNQLVSAKLPPGVAQENARKDFEPARDHAPKAAPEPAPAVVAEVAEAPEVAEVPEVLEVAEVAEVPEVPEVAVPAAQAEAPGGVFNKPSPFASAPAPEVADPQPAENVESIRRPPTAPLGSAPIPGVASSAAPVEPESAPMPVPETEPSPPVAPLGSAPIPTSQPAAPAANVIPPKPPVDIELTGENEIPDEIAVEPDYDSTVVIKPDAAMMGKKQTKNSTDAFIARVKEQLSSPENLPGNDEDAFTSTIPQ